MQVHDSRSGDKVDEAIKVANQAHNNRTLELFSCGLVSGILQAAAFNPWDRALYLSVKHTRRFLDPLNFRRPLGGLMQTITQRAMSAGLYFPLEQVFMTYLQVDLNADKYLSRQCITFLAGTFAGVSNGLLMNPFTTIKYHSWGSDDAYSFKSTADEMFKKGGIKIFFIGTMATVCRDLVFGGLFALLRHEFRHRSKESNSGVNNFAIDVAAGCCATLASSPLNYVRNIKYGTQIGDPQIPAMKILKDLWDEAMSERTVFGRLHHLQDRLKIGWGTTRVGCGMAFASLIYSFCTEQIS